MPRLYLGHHDSTRENNANEDAEERGMGSIYRMMSRLAENLGQSKTADNWMYKAWQSEKKNTSAVANELKIHNLPPWQANPQALSRYGGYSEFTKKLEEAV